MPILKKPDLLSVSFKIPRDLHDEMDSIREMAKSLNAHYDPSDAVISALRKDIVKCRKAMDVIRQANDVVSKKAI